MDAIGASIDPQPIATTMRAARLDTATHRLELQEVAVPPVGPREVLVRVEACGICMSDVHLIDGSITSRAPVVTPGHEPSGVIVAIGSDVPIWSVGDRVIVDPSSPCGVCGQCAVGLWDRCENPLMIGSDLDGAWAEYVSVPFPTLCRLPAGLSFEQAALVADAVSTPFSALVKTADVRPGDSVALWGIGGLGYHAVQVAVLCGASPVIAIDPRESARELARHAGADAVLDPAQSDFAEEVLRLTDGLGLDVAVDLVGSNRVLEQAEACIRRRGRIVVVGLSRERIELGSSEIFGIHRHQLLGHLGYTKEQLEKVAVLAARGRLDLSRSVTATYPLAEVQAAIDHATSPVSQAIRVVLTP